MYTLVKPSDSKTRRFQPHERIALRRCHYRWRYRRLGTRACNVPTWSQGADPRARAAFSRPRSWGIHLSLGRAEAKQLGIFEVLRDNCATELPWADLGFGPRNLIETTPQQLAALSFCHPEMQETLLAAAETAGAEVRPRGGGSGNRKWRAAGGFGSRE